LATTVLPRIGTDQTQTVDAITVSNENLVSIRETIDNMSTRLNIKLGSIASMVSDFIVSQNRDSTGQAEATALYGINVKLGSIAMILSTMLEENREAALRRSLTDNNEDQVREPGKKPKKGGDPFYKGNVVDDATDWSSKIIGGLITGLGVFALTAKTSFGEAFEESGIIVMVARTLTKAFIAASGIMKVVDWLMSNPIIGPIIKTFKAIGGVFHTLASRFLPLYNVSLGLVKWIGRFIPWIAAVTTLFDFLRGWNNADNVFDGIKEGIAEVAASWIGWPLEILKDIVAWAAGKLGFDNFKEMLDQVDLVGTVKTAVRSIFDTIGRMFDFSQVDGSDWTTWASGLPKLSDLAFVGINVLVNLVKDIFHIGDPEVPFNMADFLMGVVDGVGNFITNMWESAKAIGNEQVKRVETLVSNSIDDIMNFFGNTMQKIKDLLPSVDDVVKRFKSYLPEWIVGASEPLDNVKTIDSRLAEIERDIETERNKIRKSESGEDVFWGPEKFGRNMSLDKIKEANRVRDELLRERERKMTQRAPSQNITVVKGGDSQVNHSSLSVHQSSGGVSGNRADQ